MMGRLVALLDADVLYPAQVRDLMMRLATGGLLRAHWTDEIHGEWMRNVLANHPDLQRTQLERTRRLMDQALPTARVENYEHHIAALHLPDPDDRHVLAAAIETGADLLVTFNTRDFPAEVLAPLAIDVVTPEALVLTLLQDDTERVIAVMRMHRRSLRRPPLSVGDYLRVLRRGGLERVASAVETRADEL